MPESFTLQVVKHCIFDELGLENAGMDTDRRVSWYAGWVMNVPRHLSALEHQALASFAERVRAWFGARVQHSLVRIKDAIWDEGLPLS